MTRTERRPSEAEAHLKAVVNSTIEAIVTVTFDGTIVLFNRGAEEMLRVSAEDAIGSSIFRFVPEGSQESLTQGIAELLRAGLVDRQPIAEEVRTLRGDGTEFPAEVMISSFSVDGVPYVTFVSRDITRRKTTIARLDQANEQLARRASELQALFDVLPVGVGIARDPRALEITINPEFARQLGIAVDANASKSGPEGDRLPFRLVEDGRELAPEQLSLQRAALLGERVEGVEVEVHREDGTVVELLEYAAPVRDAAGALQGAVGAFIDITERKRAERVLSSARELIARTMESATNGIATLDVDLNIQYVNRRVEQLTGFSSAELVGQPAASVVASSPAALRPVFGQMLVDRTPREGFEMVVRAKDGSELDVSFGIAPLVTGEEVTGFVVAAEDISDRKRALEELRSAEQFNDRLLASVTNGIAVFDADLRFQSINAQGLAITGHGSAEQLIGRHVSHVLGWPARPKVTAAFDIVRTTLEPLRGLETEVTRPDGSRRWVSMGVAPLLDEAGTVAGFVAAAEDITDRRAAEQAMLQAQKLESLGVLAGGIAHDFNNLLVGILGNAGLALMEMAPEAPGRDTIREIELAGQRAADLVRQMLAYSGKGRFLIEPIDLNAIIDEMSHLTRASISKTVVIEHRFAGELPAVQVDATQIRQLIMNLVVNASDAIGDRDGTVSIHTGLIHADPAYLADTLLAGELVEGDYVFVEVADTGEGMDEATRARIFDPFFTTKFAGRGLGLAAVLGIVRGHGGAIRVSSEPGCGTSIRVLIPAAREPAASAPEALLDAPPVAAGTVLVVDDEPSVRHVTSRALERMGYTVLLAADGEAAIDLFQQQAGALACVLLDLTMPRMSGEEAYKAM
ncbi:MAG: hybrid sensor histidine kinase/response regulator, partial [Tepidiformaceae bacterium]